MKGNGNGWEKDYHSNPKLNINYYRRYYSKNSLDMHESIDMESCMFSTPVGVVIAPFKKKRYYLQVGFPNERVSVEPEMRKHACVFQIYFTATAMGQKIVAPMCTLSSFPNFYNFLGVNRAMNQEELQSFYEIFKEGLRDANPISTESGEINARHIEIDLENLVRRFTMANLANALLQLAPLKVIQN